MRGCHQVALLGIICLVPTCLAAQQQQVAGAPRDDLDRAVYVADVGLVRSLLNAKDTIKSGFPPVLVNRVDGLGRTALMKCGYDPQVTDRSRLDEDCAKISRLLIEAGMDIHVADVQGWTAMAYAASMGFTEVVGVLAEAGAAVDCVDQHGRTPLMKAVANGHLNTTRRLVANQASVDAVDSSGWTPLFFSVRNSMDEFWVSMVRYLASLCVPATLDAVDKNGRTALMYAVNIGNVEAVTLLLEAGADVGVVDHMGYTAISLTADPQVQALLQARIVDESARRLGQWHEQRGQESEREREEAVLRALERAILLETAA